MRPAVVYHKQVNGPLAFRTRFPGDPPDKAWVNSEYEQTDHWLIMPQSQPTNPKEHPRAMTNYSSYRSTQVTHPPGYAKSEWAGYITEYRGSNPMISETIIAVPVLPNWVGDLALQKALSKLNDGEIDLGVALAESRETAKHLNSTVDLITRQVNHFRRRNPNKVWENIKRYGSGADSRWLELQYGWSPLLNDVVGSLAAADAAWSEEDQPGNIRVTGNASTVLEERVEPDTYFGTYDPGHLASTRASCRVVLCYTLADVEAVMLSQLGLTDPLGIAWELTRLSFVADWFVPIGPWLQARSADTGWSFVQGCSSALCRLTKRRLGPLTHSWMNGPYSCQVTLYGKSGGSGVRFARTTFGQSPTPQVVLRNPLASAGLAGKFASGVALLYGALR